MLSVRLSVAIFCYACVAWTSALPQRPASNGASSGAGEIPDELPLDYRPFDGPLGKGSSGNEVFNNYDLDSEEGLRFFPEDDVNDIPQTQPQGAVGDHPVRPIDRIPEDKHPEDEPKEDPGEEEDHEPPTLEKPKGEEGTHDDEEEEAEIPGGEEKEHPVSEEEDTHAVEDEKKPHEDEEGGTIEGEGETDIPFKPSLFSFNQVNHYIKQLEKAMDNAFQQTLEESALQDNIVANTTEKEVEINGHKYKVHKSIIKTGDEDSNSTLVLEAVSSVNEDEPKNRSMRSNPDAEPNQ